VILVSEALILIALGSYTLQVAPLKLTRVSAPWMRSHLRFGWKAAFGGGLSEANSRVDILVAGSLLSDRDVGIYSLASMVIEGLVQLPTVVRNVINPLITQIALRRDFTSLRRLCVRAGGLGYGLLLAAGGLAIVLFPYALDIMIQREEFDASWPVFTVACAGLMLAAGALPLEMFLLQTGFPGLHTVYKAAVLVINVLVATILTSMYGLMGTGAASGLNFVVSAVLLMLCIRMCVGRMRRAGDPWPAQAPKA
jgi:O-antigen/teichoic acid export membrane protein